MSFFNWVSGNKENEIITPEETESTIETAKKLKSTREDEEEAQRKKYIELTKDLPKTKEVIGYKAVQYDYRPFFGDDTNLKYEIGKEYSIEGELVPCENGIHFCKSLEDVMKLFPPENGTRYLKVKCIVPIKYHLDKNDEIRSSFSNCTEIAYAKALKDYKASGNSDLRDKPFYGNFLINNLDIKYITNKMTVLKEIPFSEYSNKALNDIIRTEEEYYSTISPSEYRILLNNRIKEYCNNIFSDGFIWYWVNNKYQSESNGDFIKYCPSDIQRVLDYFKNFKEKFDAIKDENISQDIKVLFMLQ